MLVYRKKLPPDLKARFKFWQRAVSFQECGFATISLIFAPHHEQQHPGCCRGVQKIPPGSSLL